MFQNGPSWCFLLVIMHELSKEFDDSEIRKSNHLKANEQLTLETSGLYGVDLRKHEVETFKQVTNFSWDTRGYVKIMTYLLNREAVKMENWLKCLLCKDFCVFVQKCACNATLYNQQEFFKHHFDSFNDYVTLLTKNLVLSWF